VTPATAELERIALGWLVDALGLPPGTEAGLSRAPRWQPRPSAARHAILSDAGWDVEATVCSARRQSPSWSAKRRTPR
jgi:hypothetical protein